MSDWYNIDLKRRHVFLVGSCCLLSMAANVQADMSQAEIDEVTVNWKCQWCPYQKDPRKETEVEVGVGAVSNDSFKHGKYTGLDQQGNYLVGNGRFEYKDNESRYMDAKVRDLGLDSRQIEVEGGVQGKYDISLKYWQLPSLNSDTARTPYRGAEEQRLPAGWVDGASTSAMTQLVSSLRDVDIYTERKTINVDVTYHQSPSLSYDVNFQQQTKQGRKTMGLAVAFPSVILAVPVDTSTKQGGVKVNYRTQRWQGSLGYTFSLFDNAYDRFQWENAYSNTPQTGQVALEPDNEMQKITLDGVYRISKDTQATASIAVGRMTQNTDFLPYTVNPALDQPLQRSSLDGKVNTYNTTLRLGSRWNKDWSYLAQYRHNEQANETSRTTYDYVATDSAPGSLRENIPFSFRERELLLQGKYQINQQRHIVLGYMREKDDRTYQEAKTTNEDTLYVNYLSNPNEAILWRLKLHSSKRVGEEYTPVAEFAAEDPLLRKYNLADRNRKMITASLSYSLTETLQISVFGDLSNDDYFDSDVGLEQSRQAAVSFELQYRVNEGLDMSFDYTATDIDSSQAGTTWGAKNEDSTYVSHVGVNYKMPYYKLSVGANFSYANAVGDIKVSTGDGFPKLESTRKTFSVFTDYALDKKSAIHAVFSYEDYEESDWGTEDVAPDTINSVLTLGETAPSYKIGVFAISYRASF